MSVIYQSGLLGYMTPEQLFAGDAPIVTSAAKRAPGFTGAIAFGTVLALTAVGLTPFVVGTHNASQAVIVGAPTGGATGIVPDEPELSVPFYSAGFFNHEMLVWPAVPEFDSFEKRQAFFHGTPIHIGRIEQQNMNPNGNSPMPGIQ